MVLWCCEICGKREPGGSTSESQHRTFSILRQDSLFYCVFPCAHNFTWIACNIFQYLNRQGTQVFCFLCCRECYVRHPTEYTSFECWRATYRVCEEHSRRSWWSREQYCSSNGWAWWEMTLTLCHQLDSIIAMSIAASLSDDTNCAYSKTYNTVYTDQCQTTSHELQMVQLECSALTNMVLAWLVLETYGKVVSAVLKSRLVSLGASRSWLYLMAW